MTCPHTLRLTAIALCLLPLVPVPATATTLDQCNAALDEVQQAESGKAPDYFVVPGAFGGALSCATVTPPGETPVYLLTEMQQAEEASQPGSPDQDRLQSRVVVIYTPDTISIEAWRFDGLIRTTATCSRDLSDAWTRTTSGGYHCGMQLFAQDAVIVHSTFAADGTFLDYALTADMTQPSLHAYGSPYAEVMPSLLDEILQVAINVPDLDAELVLQPMTPGRFYTLTDDGGIHQLLTVIDERDRYLRLVMDVAGDFDHWEDDTGTPRVTHVPDPGYYYEVFVETGLGTPRAAFQDLLRLIAAVEQERGLAPE
ncbi:hypothetical protein [Gymnodinialimonas sp.]